MFINRIYYLLMPYADLSVKVSFAGTTPIRL